MAWSLAERLLAIPAELSRLKYPEEFVEGAARAGARALGVDFAIHWFGSPQEPLTSPGSNVVRLMVLQQDSPFAAIDLIGHEPFSPQIKTMLDHLATDLTHGLDAITHRLVRDAQRALLGILRTEDDPDELVRKATSLSVEHVRAEAGLFLSRHTTGFHVLASVGDWPVEPNAIPRWQEAAERGIEAAGAMTHPGDLVTCPVASSSPARLVLLLRFAPGHATHGTSFPVLDELVRTAAPYLVAGQRDLVLMELLKLNQVSQDTDTTELYGRVLRTAVEVIPGSGAGTLLTRQNPGEPFEYQAALGFDLEGLRSSTFSEADMQAWYGPDDHGWHRGLPRILSRNDVDIDEFGAATNPGADPKATAYASIQSTLCLPVLRDGIVMAALNLDNLVDPGAFGTDSTHLAFLFGSPLSSLLHRQQTHELLHKAALVDELTGLANRRAFDQALERELARASRTGSQPSVLLLDVRGFKLINDRFGHEVGDQALILMGDALKRSLRATDLPARRGGDEFVALLADTPAAEAVLIAERVRDTISSIIIRDDVRLAVNIGAATAPADGDTATQLLRVADERMYLQKMAGRGAG